MRWALGRIGKKRRFHNRKVSENEVSLRVMVHDPFGDTASAKYK